MKSKYTHLKDGDSFNIVRDPDGLFGSLYFACCDCGLVHRFEFSDDEKAIRLVMFRDNRRTAAYRRHHRIVVTKH